MGEAIFCFQVAETLKSGFVSVAKYRMVLRLSLFAILPGASGNRLINFIVRGDGFGFGSCRKLNSSH